MIEIKNLHVEIEGKALIKGLNLQVNKGEIHAIMGPNGAGKSTLAKVLAGHPSYEVTQGDILFHGKSILNLEPEERMHLGIFMTFQYPVEVAGVHNNQFLFSAYNALRKAKGESILNESEFETILDEQMQLMNIKEEFKERGVNEGFSGGEKKRNEILQMTLFKPELAILDETDSGLDIDAIRVVADGVNRLSHSENGLILITHYQRLLEYIKPQIIHVMIEGRIVRSAGPELALELEEKGYDWLEPLCEE